MPPKRKRGGSIVAQKEKPAKRPRKVVKEEHGDSSPLSDPPTDIDCPQSKKGKKNAFTPVRKPKKNVFAVLDEDKLGGEKATLEDNEALLDKSFETSSGESGGETSDEESDDDAAWETVDLGGSSAATPVTAGAPIMPRKDLNLTLEKHPTSIIERKKSSITAMDRTIRALTHCMHVQCLLAHGRIRNQWINDEEVKGILLSMVPQSVLSIWNCEDPHKHFGRLLDALQKWWRIKFKITKPGLRKVGYTPIASKDDPSAKGDHDNDEVFKSIKELREAAAKLEGSRDLGAQLFTSLLRAIGIDARMVFSLQPLGYGFGKYEDAPKRKKKKADGITTATESELSAVESSTTAKSRPASELNASELDDSLSDADSAISDSQSTSKRNVTPKKKTPSPDADLTYPFFWTEVYDEGKRHQWVPAETLVLRNCDTSNPENYEPRGKIAEERRMVMCYVVAFEEDGYAKDVTMRYVKNFPGKAKAFRVWPTSKARGNKVETQDWWRGLLTPLLRPERTERDEKEDKALQRVTEKETKAPTTIGAYKDHPEFVLERHLKREEAMKPDAKPVRELAVGKGEKAKTEKVYRRADIELVFGVEAWYKEGRKVKVGEEPLKKVKARAVTLTRKREHEQQMAENEGPVLQGLYAKYQTELYRPPPVVDGVVPKNSYGNADCFVPTMIPEGAVHLPHRGIAKVAKKLGIDYAEAITGFEFKSQRAIPVATGVLVATENADIIMEAFREAEQIRLEKESGKREAEALKKWRKFIVGMRIRERLIDEYGNDHEGLKKHEERQSEFAHLGEDEGHGGFVTGAHVKDDEEKVDAFDRDFGGGFLPKGMDVELLPEKGGVVDEGGGFLPEGDGDDDVKPEPEFAISYGGGFIPDDIPTKANSPIREESPAAGSDDTEVSKYFTDVKRPKEEKPNAQKRGTMQVEAEASTTPPRRSSRATRNTKSMVEAMVDDAVDELDE
ncbi:hypothetical protein YB2330_004103 [Saitoella coloradoensis]